MTSDARGQFILDLDVADLERVRIQSNRGSLLNQGRAQHPNRPSRVDDSFSLTSTIDQ